MNDQKGEDGPNSTIAWANTIKAKPVPDAAYNTKKKRKQNKSIHWLFCASKTILHMVNELYTSAMLFLFDAQALRQQKEKKNKKNN